METGDGRESDHTPVINRIISSDNLPTTAPATMKRMSLAAMTPFWKKSPVNLLDWYIIRKFLGTYIFAIILILAIVIMFDINEKLESFIKAPLKATVFDYFLKLSPLFRQPVQPAVHLHRRNILHLKTCRQLRNNSHAF